MLRKTLQALSLIVIAPLSVADELGDLITTSEDIRATFRYGISAVGGMAHYARNNGIAYSGVVDPGLIDKAKQDAYNNALQNFKNATYTWDPNAEDYFTEQSNNSLNAMSEAIDAYVDAATAVVMITTIGTMAEEAAQAPDARETIALQEYAEANDVYLDDTEVEDYNSALESVEVAAQAAAAYTTVANDASLLESANDAAYAMNVTFEESNNTFFDAATGTLTVEWEGESQSIALDLNAYFMQDTDIITTGADTLFYRTSPEGGCWFIEDQTERENCMYGS